MKRIILITLMTLCCFAFLSADVYIKSNTHSDAFKMMGKEMPAKDEVTEQWIGKDRFANIKGNEVMVVDAGKKKLFIIYHNDKTYVEANLPLDLNALLPEQAKQMMSMMKMSIKVNPTNETKKIGDWNCKGYDMVFSGAMFSMTMKSWVTKDVPFDWKYFNDHLLGVFMKSTMVGLEGDIMAEMKKIEGFQVASETTVSAMGSNIKSSIKILEITEKDAPAGIYSAPVILKKIN